MQGSSVNKKHADPLVSTIANPTNRCIALHPSNTPRSVQSLRKQFELRIFVFGGRATTRCSRKVSQQAKRHHKELVTKLDHQEVPRQEKKRQPALVTIPNLTRGTA